MTTRIPLVATTHLAGACIAIAMLITSCDVDQRSPEFSCDQTGNCPAGRECVQGWCVTDTDDPDDVPPVDCTVCVEASCTQECGAGADCALECDNECDCALDCTGASNCQVDCSNDSICEIDCTGADTCSDIRCRNDAGCLVHCSGANDCGFADCEDEVLSCAGDIIVCNRACP